MGTPPITSLIKSQALLPKSNAIERLDELSKSLKRKAGDSGPGFTLTTGGGRETQVGFIPADECELPVPKGTGALVYSTRIEDYRRWIPLVRAEQVDGRQRFHERYMAEVIVPRCGDDLYDDKGKLHAALEEELQREWMRTADANQRIAKRELRNCVATKAVSAAIVPWRPTSRTEPVSTEVLLDSLRALPIRNVVQMLDSTCNREPVNIAAMEAAEKIILEERGDAIAAERARLQHAFEVAEGIAPAPKRQASEVGPFGETTDTHDIVWVNEKSGAGKGQTMTTKTWVLKSTPVKSTVDNESAPYIDSWSGIEFN